MPPTKLVTPFASVILVPLPGINVPKLEVALTKLPAIGMPLGSRAVMVMRVDGRGGCAAPTKDEGSSWMLIGLLDSLLESCQSVSAHPYRRVNQYVIDRWWNTTNNELDEQPADQLTSQAIRQRAKPHIRTKLR